MTPRERTLFTVFLTLAGYFLLTKGKKMLWTTPKLGMQYEPLFRQASDKYGLPPGLISKVASVETGGSYNPKAVSPAGAQGLMQFMPATARFFRIDPFNPGQAIDAGGRYLRDLYNLFGSWQKALAGYNWGESRVITAVRKYGPDWLQHAPDETKKYVAVITRDVGLI